MYDRVLAEFASGKLDADYADLTDLTLIKEWVSRGILAAHKVPWHDKIAANLKHPDGRWYYIVRPIYVIGVNTAEVDAKDFPKTWKETGRPTNPWVARNVTTGSKAGWASTKSCPLRKRCSGSYCKTQARWILPSKRKKRACEPCANPVF
jgi:hypothetical protein